MASIKKVITVAILKDDIPNHHNSFGTEAESSFPEAHHLTVFLDDENNFVGFGSQEYYLTDKLGKLGKSYLNQLVPFLKAEDTYEWFFSTPDTPVTDDSKPTSIEDLSVCFNWEGDATQLESSLQEEEPDDWEDELQTFRDMLDDPQTLAVGWKYVRECDWSVDSDEALTRKFYDADWDSFGECCFVIQRY